MRTVEPTTLSVLQAELELLEAETFEIADDAVRDEHAMMGATTSSTTSCTSSCTSTSSTSTCN